MRTAVPIALLLLVAGCSSASEPVGAPKLREHASAPKPVNHPHGAPTPLHAGLGDSGAGGKVSYFGGPIVSNPHIYEISWTSAVPAALQAGLAGPTGFYQTITNSPYWTLLSQYSTVGLVGSSDGLAGSNQTLGPGTFVQAIVITPANQNTTISDVDIFEELLNQITKGVIPPVDLDAAGNVNSVYMVDFPSSISLTLGGTPLCTSGIYGYHQSLQVTEDSVPYSIPFGVVPDVLEGTCLVSGPNLPLDVSYALHSHELSEAVTDPQNDLAHTFDRPYAWDDSNVAEGEIADLCAGYLGTAGGFTVQQLWSNINGGCVAIPPPCNGSVDPPFCTPCTASSQCSAPTPACETTAGSPLVGECVACTASEVAGCTGGTPYCDTTTDTCRACTSSDCTAPTAICETSGAAAGTCVTCDATNSAACTGATPVCDPAVYICVGCVTASDCKDAAMPICDVGTQTCRACAANSDCPGEVCVTSASNSKVGECVGCVQDSDCGGSNGDCDTTTNTCTCTTNEQCSNPTPTCANSTCVPCKSASDCVGNKGGSVCSNGSCKGGMAEPGESKDAGRDTGAVPTHPDGGTGSSGGGCSTAQRSRASEVLSFLLPLVGFVGFRRRRRR